MKPEHQQAIDQVREYLEEGYVLTWVETAEVVRGDNGRGRATCRATGRTQLVITLEKNKPAGQEASG